MKGQADTTSIIACRAMLQTESSHKHQKNCDQQKHDVEIPQNWLLRSGSQNNACRDPESDFPDYDSLVQLDFFDL